MHRERRSAVARLQLHTGWLDASDLFQQGIGFQQSTDISRDSYELWFDQTETN